MKIAVLGQGFNSLKDMDEFKALYLNNDAVLSIFEERQEARLFATKTFYVLAHRIGFEEEHREAFGDQFLLHGDANGHCYINKYSDLTREIVDNWFNQIVNQWKRKNKPKYFEFNI